MINYCPIDININKLHTAEFKIMLTRKQVALLKPAHKRKDNLFGQQLRFVLLAHKHENNFFGNLPDDMIGVIADHMIANANDYWRSEEDPGSEIAQALHYAAYARQEDVEALLAMLEKNPRLLLQAGNVITPGGLDCQQVTLYEFCLGAGDPELAEKVQAYFAKLTDCDGEKERVRQYERYRPHIEGMLTQEPYDLSSLIGIIKKASTADVTAMLANNMTHKSDLCDAMIQFRKDHAPGELTTPRMHYNYRSLQHAFQRLYDEWDNLYQACGSTDKYDKIRLVWRQLIGFLLRRLPGVDRCAVAQGLYYLLEKQSAEEFDRSYTFKHYPSDGSLPLTLTDSSAGGLGLDVSLDIYGGVLGWGGRVSSRVALENLCRAKTASLSDLCSDRSDTPQRGM